MAAEEFKSRCCTRLLARRSDCVALTLSCSANSWHRQHARLWCRIYAPDIESVQSAFSDLDRVHVCRHWVLWTGLRRRESGANWVRVQGLVVAAANWFIQPLSEQRRIPNHSTHALKGESDPAGMSVLSTWILVHGHLRCPGVILRDLISWGQRSRHLQVVVVLGTPGTYLSWDTN